MKICPVEKGGRIIKKKILRFEIEHVWCGMMQRGVLVIAAADLKENKTAGAPKTFRCHM